VSMEELLKGILGGADSQAPGKKAGADPLADLLRGILGGGAAPQAGSGQSAAAGLPDLLRGILGGGRQGAGGFGLDDILGGILGGGGANIAANPFLAPIVQGLAEKLGLSPAIAQAVVGFAISKLLPAMLGATGEQVPSSPPRRTTKRRRKTPAPDKGLNLDHLLERMGSGEALQPAYLRSTGMVDELTQQTGLEEDVALQSLQQVFGLFGAQLGRAEPPQPKSRLDHLLDTWED